LKSELTDHISERQRLRKAGQVLLPDNWILLCPTYEAGVDRCWQAGKVFGNVLVDVKFAVPLEDAEQ
jgi:hypothetical protein